MFNDIGWLQQRTYSTRSQKTLLFIAALTVLLFLLPRSVYSEEVYLSWNENQESDLAGYRIYYGTTSGSHSVKIEVGNTNSYTLTHLEPGKTYYFSATAYDTSGNESDFSQEVSFHLPTDDDDGSDSGQGSGPDGDSDGVQDADDNCPNTANAGQADADGDGLGDACDPLTDSDEDGMPDDWEIQNGLDPNRDDAAADPDDDGISNLDEYQGQTDPGVYDENDEPDAPALYAPLNRETVGLTSQLQTEQFYDPDFGDTHRQTQWQIIRQSDDRVVLEIISDYMLTELPVPKMVLEEDSLYSWRARFYDNHGLASAWSQTAQFETGFQTEDSDSNGILDDQEVDVVLDLNDDGTADLDQENIKCVNVQGANGQIGISIEDSPTVVSIEALESMDPSDPLFDGRNGLKPEQMTFGLVHFKLLLNEVGATATVKVHLSEPAPAGSRWYKFDPIAETWLDYSDYAVLSDDRKSVTLTITDGGYGDLDGIANGIIIDPSGLGLPSGSSGGGEDVVGALDDLVGGTVDGLASAAGCFISTAAQPAQTMPGLNPGSDFGGRLLVFPILLLIAVAVGRKLKFLKSFDQSAKMLGVGCLLLIFIMATAPMASAKDTTAPNAPGAFTVSFNSGTGDDATPADGGSSVCVEADEGYFANLSCPGEQTITRIEFAGYGLSTGSCSEGYTQGSCHAADSRSIVEAACLNQSECAISAGNGVFGDPCSGKRKRLAIAYTCGDDGGDQQAQDQLMKLGSALNALSKHISGATTLNANQIKQQQDAVTANEVLFESNGDVIADALAVVAAYESTYGPLWLNDKTRNVTIPKDPAGGLELEYAMIAVMQGLIDHAYVPGNLTRFRNILDGALFETSRYFPGAVDPPANSSVSYDAKINASQPAKWGSPVMYDNDPARRPTGCYVAPGSIVTVDVPASIVGKGYAIRVGAHSWDLSGKPRYERLDRISLRYPITATRTLVGNPLGGGIYIEVPPLADAGIVAITITNAVRSPFYSDKPFHQTSMAQWLESERHHPAPWADFESEKFMMQVPTNWIYAYDSPDVTMQNWDKAMDIVSDLMGKPRNRDGQTVLYMQPDVIIKGGAYHPGYPMSNDPYDPLRDEKGNKEHFFLTGPRKGTSTTFHELGHAELFTKFPGETEAVVNFLYVAVMNRGFGFSLDRAFSLSMGNKETISLDQAAIMWLVTENFRQGNPMNITNSTKNEVRYQHRGYAKYTEIANLFGWEALDDFWYSVNVDYMDGIKYNRNNDEADSRILRMSRTAGADLRPLVHFWGVHPNNDDDLKADMQREGLMPSALIYDRLMHYKTLIPMNNTEFNDHADIVYPERDGTGHVDYGKGWYSVWDKQYNDSHGTAAQEALQDIIDHYFPDGRPGT